MNTDPNIQDIGSDISNNAVSLYGQDGGLDDFPVLKAFQQYIDAEQAKARKRLLGLCSFFGLMMIVVIAVFLVMLMNISSRNQTLNDRLVEFAMRERERPANGSPVVVQQPAQQDSAAILALTAKMDEMRKKLADDQAKAEKAVAEAQKQAEAAEKKAAAQSAALAEATKGPTPEELEIKRLKALLATEKEKNSLELEKKRQAELEEYRRKHYPELYEKPANKPSRISADDILNRLDDILDDNDAISYYDDDTADEEIVIRKRPSSRKAKRTVPAVSKSEAPDAASETSAEKENYSIPVDIKGSSSGTGGNWLIPND